jgi:hypothetical protein
MDKSGVRDRFPYGKNPRTKSLLRENLGGERPKEILLQKAGSCRSTGLPLAIFLVAAACVGLEGVSCARIMGSHPSATALKAVADEAELIAGWEKEQEDIRSRISEVFCTDPPQVF